MALRAKNQPNQIDVERPISKKAEAKEKKGPTAVDATVDAVKAELLAQKPESDAAVVPQTVKVNPNICTATFLGQIKYPQLFHGAEIIERVAPGHPYFAYFKKQFEPNAEEEIVFITYELTKNAKIARKAYGKVASEAILIPGHKNKPKPPKEPKPPVEPVKTPTPPEPIQPPVPAAPPNPPAEPSSNLQKLRGIIQAFPEHNFILCSPTPAGEKKYKKLFENALTTEIMTQYHPRYSEFLKSLSPQRGFLIVCFTTKRGGKQYVCIEEEHLIKTENRTDKIPKPYDPYPNKREVSSGDLTNCEMANEYIGSSRGFLAQAKTIEYVEESHPQFETLKNTYRPDETECIVRITLVDGSKKFGKVKDASIVIAKNT